MKTRILKITETLQNGSVLTSYFPQKRVWGIWMYMAVCRINVSGIHLTFTHTRRYANYEQAEVVIAHHKKSLKRAETLAVIKETKEVVSDEGV